MSKKKLEETKKEIKIVNKYMKRYSTTVIGRKQIKTQ